MFQLQPPFDNVITQLILLLMLLLLLLSSPVCMNDFCQFCLNKAVCLREYSQLPATWHRLAGSCWVPPPTHSHLLA